MVTDNRIPCLFCKTMCWALAVCISVESHLQQSYEVGGVVTLNEGEETKALGGATYPQLVSGKPRCKPRLRGPEERHATNPLLVWGHRVGSAAHVEYFPRLPPVLRGAEQKLRRWEGLPGSGCWSLQTLEGRSGCGGRRRVANLDAQGSMALRSCPVLIPGCLPQVPFPCPCL